jgi:hypothetical protein
MASNLEMSPPKGGNVGRSPTSGHRPPGRDAQRTLGTHSRSGPAPPGPRVAPPEPVRGSSPPSSRASCPTRRKMRVAVPRRPHARKKRGAASGAMSERSESHHSPRSVFSGFLAGRARGSLSWGGSIRRGVFACMRGREWAGRAPDALLMAFRRRRNAARAGAGAKVAAARRRAKRAKGTETEGARSGGTPGLEPAAEWMLLLVGRPLDAAAI